MPYKTATTLFSHNARLLLMLLQWHVLDGHHYRRIEIIYHLLLASAVAALQKCFSNSCPCLMTHLGPSALCHCRRNQALVSHLSEGRSSLLEQQQGSSSEGRCSRGTGHPIPPPAAPGSVSAPPGWTVIRKESYIPWAFLFPASTSLFLIFLSKSDLLPTLRRRVLQSHKMFPREAHLGSTGSLLVKSSSDLVSHCPVTSLSPPISLRVDQVMFWPQ